MSLSAMSLTTKKNPDKVRTFNYRQGLWNGNVSVADIHFNGALDLITYLKSKYKKVYYFRVKLAKTFGNKFIKPKEIYKDDMDHADAEPNLIMVSDGSKLLLVTTKAKRAKEFDMFGSFANNVYVPVFLYKDSNNKTQLINFK